MAQITSLADNIVATLNAGSYSMTLTAERKIRVRADLSVIQDLVVWVVPRSVTQEVNTRVSDMATYTVQIAVMKAAVTDEEIDGLMDLVEELASEISRVNYDGFRYSAQSNDPIYEPNRIDDEAVFMSIIEVEYKGLRT